jgi:hypothetical protein
MPCLPKNDASARRGNLGSHFERANPFSAKVLMLCIMRRLASFDSDEAPRDIGKPGCDLARYNLPKTGPFQSK